MDPDRLAALARGVVQLVWADFHFVARGPDQPGFEELPLDERIRRSRATLRACDNSWFEVFTRDTGLVSGLSRHPDAQVVEAPLDQLPQTG